MADLVTLQEYKDYAGITSTTQDTQISSLIPKISEMVKVYVGRRLVDWFDTPKEEFFNGGYPLLMLEESPVVNIFDIDYSIDYGQTYNSLVEFVDYVFNKSTGTIDVLGIDKFPKQTNAFRVTYSAGYASIPEDLKLAVLDLISYYMKSDMSVKSTRSAGSNTTQVEYVMNTTLPSHIRRVLDMYRLDL